MSTGTRTLWVLVLFVMGWSWIFPQELPAQPSEEKVTAASVQKEMQALREQYEREVGELRRKIAELESQTVAAGEETHKVARPSSRPPVIDKKAPPTAIATEKKASEAEAAQRKAEKGAETILVERGGILLPKGTLAVEPSLNYTHFSANSLIVSGFTILDAILIGRIQVEEIKRDILTSALTFRYGLTNRLQIEGKIPAIYRHDRLVRPQTQNDDILDDVRITDGFGLGDIEGAVSFHAYQSTNWLPDVLLNVRGKSTTGRDPYGLELQTIEGIVFTTEVPTGTGHYGISSGVTLVKAFDPVVFFTAANYFWNIQRNVGGGFGTIDPGDSIEYVLGTAVALSERTALNLAFQNIFTMSTSQNGIDIAETNLNSAVVSFGISHRLTEKASLLLSLGAGLTTDSPDFQLQVTIPWHFSLR